MKCLQKLYLLPFWSVVSLCLFCILFLTMINITSVSAVSDISVTYTSIPTLNDDVFPDCSTSSCLSQYSYLIVYISQPFVGSYRMRPLFALGNSNYITISPTSSFAVYSIPGSPFQFTFFASDLSTNYPWSGGITFTLTENYQSCISPSGSLSIIENGTYDVTNYAEAVVDVPVEIIPGDYHDDLVNLKQAIILVPAVCLVIYFFYAIYKMIMGGVRR